jgi:hypothetical protein
MSKGQNETPQTKIEFNDFPGLFLLEDPIDLQPGAGQDQLNIKSDMEGSLTVRGGMLPVSFDYQG